METACLTEATHVGKKYGTSLKLLLTADIRLWGFFYFLESLLSAYCRSTVLSYQAEDT